MVLPSSKIVIVLITINFNINSINYFTRINIGFYVAAVWGLAILTFDPQFDNNASLYTALNLNLSLKDYSLWFFDYVGVALSYFAL